MKVSFLNYKRVARYGESPKKQTKAGTSPVNFTAAATMLKQPRGISLKLIEGCDVFKSKYIKKNKAADFWQGDKGAFSFTEYDVKGKMHSFFERKTNGTTVEKFYDKAEKIYLELINYFNLGNKRIEYWPDGKLKRSFLTRPNGEKINQYYDKNGMLRRMVQVHTNGAITKHNYGKDGKMTKIIAEGYNGEFYDKSQFTPDLIPIRASMRRPNGFVDRAFYYPDGSPELVIVNRAENDYEIIKYLPGNIVEKTIQQRPNGIYIEKEILNGKVSHLTLKAPGEVNEIFCDTEGNPVNGIRETEDGVYIVDYFSNGQVRRIEDEFGNCTKYENLLPDGITNPHLPSFDEVLAQNFALNKFVSTALIKKSPNFIPLNAN